jgi:hypothetical protein
MIVADQSSYYLLDPNTPNGHSETAVFLAKSDGALGMLVAWGARLNAGDERRETPLHRAAKWGHRPQYSLCLMQEPIECC